MLKQTIINFCALIFLSLYSISGICAQTIIMAVPGPGSLAFLPAYLAKAIGADKAEGIDLRLRYFNGGPLAIRDLVNNNSDFAVVGLPAVAAARAEDMPIVAIGQLSQSAMFVFLLRSELSGQVKTIAQLKGRRIGTASSTKSQRSMGRMMTEYLIQRAGLETKDVQFISTGLNRESQYAALESAAVDAIMGDEPFASEFVTKHLAVRLADLYPPNESGKLLGGPIIHASLATREDVFAEHPEVVVKVQRIFSHTLNWMATHSAQDTVDQLRNQPGFNKSGAKLLAEILQRNRGMFPEFIGWDPQAVANTETFFHSMAVKPKESKLPFNKFVHNVPLQ